jgi:hypothetical protein
MHWTNIVFDISESAWQKTARAIIQQAVMRRFPLEAKGKSGGEFMRRRRRRRVHRKSHPPPRACVCVCVYLINAREGDLSRRLIYYFDMHRQLSRVTRQFVFGARTPALSLSTISTKMRAR